MEILVGNTGFVGSNICSKHHFDGLYNSENFKESYGTNPELLVYSGVPAQKFIANKFPSKDFEVIEGAIENITNINPKEIVLISTIDVYKDTENVTEDSEINEDELEPYGKNRYYLEKWVKDNFENYLIVHLPGLYGQNIKKNFIYDLINIVPSMIKKEKYEDITKIDKYLDKYYKLQDNGFYVYQDFASNEEKEKLKTYFTNLGFTALNFTDSRGIFQFYNLEYLWEHIQIARKNNIKVLNLATEPVQISEVYEYVKNSQFKNEFSNNIPHYNFKTKYANLFNGKNGYIFDKTFVLEDIKAFIERNEVK